MCEAQASFFLRLRLYFCKGLTDPADCLNILGYHSNVSCSASKRMGNVDLFHVLLSLS